MLVVEIMDTNVQTIGLSDAISDAALKMRREGVGCLVVVSGGTVYGIITERDIAVGCPADGHIPWHCQVFRHMTIQASSVHPGMDVSSAVVLMMENETDYIPVVDGKTLIGVVSSEEASRAMEREFSYEFDDARIPVGAD